MSKRNRKKKKPFTRVDVANAWAEGFIFAQLYLIDRGVRDLCTLDEIYLGGDRELFQEIVAITEKTISEVRNDGKFKHRAVKMGKAFPFIVLAAEGCEDKADRLIELLLKNPKTHKDHEELGRLYGYGESQIKEWASEDKGPCACAACA